MDARFGSISGVVLVVTALVLLSMYSVAEASAAEDDLSLLTVTIIQVIPDPEGLVANKSTGIYVMVFSTFTTEVLVDIKVTYDHGEATYTEKGPTDDGVPIAPGQNAVYLPGGNCTAHPEVWETEVPAFIWTSRGADDSIVVELDPDNEIAEADESNNFLGPELPIQVYDGRSISILVIPVYKRSRSFTFSLEEEVEELIEMYPLPDDGVTIVEAPPAYRNFTLISQASDIARSFSAEARALGYDRVITVFEELTDSLGFSYYGSAVGVLDEPRDPVPIYLTRVGIDERAGLLAHELGHTYYLWHPHDIGIRVYDAMRTSVTDREYNLYSNTFMSYPSVHRLPSGVPLSPRWVDLDRYQNHERSWIDLTRRFLDGPPGTWEWNLFDQLVFSPFIFEPITVIQCTLFRTGEVVLRPWYSVPLGVPDQTLMGQTGADGMYSVRMLDAGRSDLGRTYFNVTFATVTHHEELDEEVVEQVDSVDCVINAKQYAGTRYVQIVDPEGTVLAEREVSPVGPTVELLTPNGGEEVDIGSGMQVSWTANDPDSDNLTYFVSYSEDGGETWIPVASNLTSTEYAWSTAGVAPTAECLVKVMATDGFNTAEDVSDAVFGMVDSDHPLTTVELEGTLGENEWYVSEINVTFTASDNSRVERTEYSFDASSWTICDGKLRYSDEGSRTLYFRSVDIGGNVEPVKTATLKVDTVAPTVTIDAPVQGSSYPEDIEILWHGTDNSSGIQGYEVRLDSGEWTDLGTSTAWNVSDLAEGVHTVEVRVTDNAGHTTIAEVEFSVKMPSGIATELLLALGAAVACVLGALGLYYLRMRRR